MKRLILFFLIGAFFMASTSLYASEKTPLGVVNTSQSNWITSIKFDYINFYRDELENSAVDTEELYVGLEVFAEITSNLYLGGEVGYANPDGSVNGINIDFQFFPVELNLKYRVKAAPKFVIDFGAGVSFNYVEEETPGLTEDDWLFGGQFFVDLNYTSDKFFIGINGKYQPTEDFEDTEYDYGNWRIGVQIGFKF